MIVLQSAFSPRPYRLQPGEGASTVYGRQLVLT